MTVSTTTAKVSYTGNGSTTAFAVPFVFFSSAELEVIERTIATGAEVVKTLTTHYTVTGGDGATGTVTALTAPASTVEWHIRRKTARTQLVDYQANDAFPADTHERALDRAAARDQEIEETVGRALVFPKTDSSALDPELPASVDRASKYLAFDVDGNPVATAGTSSDIVATPFAETLLDDANAAAMRTTLGLTIASDAETKTGTATDRVLTPANLAARVPVSSTLYQRLQQSASSGVLQYTGEPGFKNIAGRNGGLEVWQRGAGGSASISVAASTTAYTADGWALKTGANQASTVAQVAGIATGSRWAARVRRNSGQTGTGAMNFEFPLDTDEIVFMQGCVVTLSMTLQAGANWSPTSGNLTIELRTGTGSAAKRSAGAYTGDAAPISVTQAITSSAVRYTFTSTALGASVTQASIYLTWTPTGTAGAADDFTIDDVQLEISPVATPFERRPFLLELLACERFYEKSYDYGTAAGTSTNNGAVFLAVYGATPATDLLYVPFLVRKRVAPSVTVYSTTGASGNVRNMAGADIAATVTAIGERSCTVNFATGAALSVRAHYTADAGI